MSLNPFSINVNNFLVPAIYIPFKIYEHWRCYNSYSRARRNFLKGESKSVKEGLIRGKGVARGKPPPPETEKIVVENGVISEGSIFSNKFSKIK